MTTLAADTFSNDSAVEWAAAYREMGLGVAASTLDVALGDLQNGDLSEDIAARGLAAAEAVAFALGRGSDRAAEVFAGAPEADQGAAEALVENATRLIEAMAGGSDLPAGLAALADRLHRPAMESASTPDIDATPERPRPAVAPTPHDAPGELQAIRDDIEALRKQMNRNFARLAQMIEGRNS